MTKEFKRYRGKDLHGEKMTLKDKAERRDDKKDMPSAGMPVFTVTPRKTHPKNFMGGYMKSPQTPHVRTPAANMPKGASKDVMAAEKTECVMKNADCPFEQDAYNEGEIKGLEKVLNLMKYDDWEDNCFCEPDEQCYCAVYWLKSHIHAEIQKLKGETK